MKSDLKAKFLQHILKRKENEEGFTLIELLVVIIIIGILSAIALPAFLNQANKARSSEAKTTVGSINRAQQAYILENPTFVTQQTAFDNLELGIKTQTENYQYVIGASGTTGVTATGRPTTPAGSPAILKAFVGTVSVAQTQATGGQATTIGILCETVQPQLNSYTTVAATLANNNLTCPTGQRPVR